METLKEHIREQVEKKEKLLRKVVRVFLSQSRSMEEVSSIIKDMQKKCDEEGKAFDFEHLFFTTVVWAEKSDKSVQNAGQVMPVGGKVEKFDKDDLSKTAIREVLEETHLRVLDLKPFSTNINYSLQTKNGDIDIEQNLFFGRILPTDTPYPLDPTEDKINRFHKMDLKMMGSLYSEGIKLSDGKDIKLLGNLRLPYGIMEDDEKIKRSKDDVEKVGGVFVELSKRSQDIERKKRESVMNLVYKYLSQSETSEDIEVLYQQFLKAKDFSQHQKAFQKLCTVLQDRYGSEEFLGALKTAIEASNFEEEMVLPASQESYIEAVLHVIYVLLETKGDYDAFLDIAQKNKNVAPFVKKIKEFIEALTDEENPGSGSEYKKRNLRHKLSSLKDLSDDLITYAFCDVFGIDEESVPERLRRINEFLDKLVSSAIVSNGNLGKNESNLIETTSEIAQASLAKLVRYAFPFGDNSWKKGFDKIWADKEEVKLQVFEARRQLAFLYAYIQTDEYYDKTIAKGNDQISSLWGKEFVSAPNLHLAVENIYEEGERKDIKVYEHISKDNFSEKKGYQKVAVRRMSLEGKPSFLAKMDVRTKDRGSLYRKIIERGFNDPTHAKDIYGRLFVIARDQKDADSFDYIRRRETRSIRVAGELKECNDLAPVLDIMEHMSQKEGVTIIDYTPTPQEGQVFSSKGSAGGGKIRLAKFYIEHRSEDGTVRHEEVQIFTPSEEKTAFFYYEQKKEDDKRYYFERLMDTKGYHSVLELLFPTAIYGKAMHDLRVVHTRKKKNGKKK